MGLGAIAVVGAVAGRVYSLLCAVAGVRMGGGCRAVARQTVFMTCAHAKYASLGNQYLKHQSDDQRDTHG